MAAIFGFALVILTAALCGWLCWRLLRNSEDPLKIVFKVVLSVLILGGLAVSTRSLGVLAPGVAVFCAVILAILWAPHMGAVLAKPFTSLFDGGDLALEARPLYSMAITRLKKGQYTEAIAEVHKQLARFPDDFGGWILLAEIYGDHLKDLESAEHAIQQILGHSSHTPLNIAYALNRLADWQLSLGQDRAAAQASLEAIIHRYPQSEHAHNAAQRIAHLTTSEMLAEAKKPSVIPLPHRNEYIGLQGQVADPTPLEETPAQAASRLLAHLSDHPTDYEAREQLGLIYARDFQRIDLAADQLEVLIAIPNQTQKHVAHWLNMLADWNIQYAGNLTSAKLILERLVDLYPGSAVAANAEKRIAYLPLEMKKKAKSQVVPLGSYEQNLGLKEGPPRKH
jgi:outer membrane protein assembly factor BamD (BamD/ComL family)